MGILAIILGLWVLPVGLVAGIFALFLAYQAYSLRIVFTRDSFEVLRTGTRLRSFPYQDWLTWKVFWPGFPVVFYFREVKSIHLIPMLFDPSMLTTCLERFLGSKGQSP